MWDKSSIRTTSHGIKMATRYCSVQAHLRDEKLEMSVEKAEVLFSLGTPFLTKLQLSEQRFGFGKLSLLQLLDGAPYLSWMKLLYLGDQVCAPWRRMPPQICVQRL